MTYLVTHMKGERWVCIILYSSIYLLVNFIILCFSKNRTWLFVCNTINLKFAKLHCFWSILFAFFSIDHWFFFLVVLYYLKRAVTLMKKILKYELIICMYYKYHFSQRIKNNSYVSLVNIYNYNQRNKYYDTSFIYLSVLRHFNMVCFWRKKSF